MPGARFFFLSHAQPFIAPSPKICRLADVLYAFDAYCVKYLSCRGRSPILSARSTLVHSPTGPFVQPRSNTHECIGLRSAASGYQQK